MSERIPNPSPSDALNIQARAPEHEALIRRQGQAARIIQLIKCPCNNNGKPDIYCTLCNGRGQIFRHQKSASVIDENSDHYGCGEVTTYGSPITKAVGIQRRLHESQGGTTVYNITSFDDTKIYFTAPGGSCVPKRYEKVQVTYEYSLESSVISENSSRDSIGYTMHTIATLIEFNNTSNPYQINGDLTEVTRIYNKTTDTTYNVKSFSKQTIVADDESGAKAAIELTDVLEVDYKYVKPAQIGTGRMQLNNALQKWGEDIKSGDVQAIIPGYYYFSKGDIITFLFPRIRETTVIKRGTGLKDELPQFDVNEIIYEIIDEDGTKYTNDGTKFYLSEYNDLNWVSGQGPATGKKYTVTYLFHPTYRVYKQEIDLMSNENKQFPNLVQLRYMQRFNKKDFARF